MSNGNRNAKRLLDIIIGSAEVQQTYENFEKDRERFLKSFVKNLREKVRTQIDANLPFMYLVDANQIVTSMLQTLNPANKKINPDGENKQPTHQSPYAEYETTGKDRVRGIELFKYFKSVTGTDSDGVIHKYTNQSGSASEDLKEAYRVAYTKLVAKAELTVTNVIEKIKNGISSEVTVDKLVEIVSGATQAGQPQEVGKKLRTELNKLGVSKVSNAQLLLTDYQSSSQILVIGQNFDSVTKVVHRYATDALEEALLETGLEPATVTEKGVKGFKAGNFAAAGHSGLSYGPGRKLLGINTPLLQMTTLLLGMQSSSYRSQLNTIYNDFVLTTDHKDWLININEDYRKFGRESLKLFFAFGRSQDSVYNSKVIGSQETTYINNELERLLKTSYRRLKEQLEKKFEDVAKKNKNVQQFLLDEFKMSPTLKQNTILGIKAIFDGVPYTGPSGTANNNSSPRKKDTTVVPKANLSTQKAKADKNRLVKPISTAKTFKSIRSIVDLPMLMMFINSNLHEQMKKNMGTGNRRDVLNYRTGRLAMSAKVERLSESRQGMITAFYSYMKNPYATFSRGGRQEQPYTRDPKSLISKSIRELAGKQVANRMRAVLV